MTDQEIKRAADAVAGTVPFCVPAHTCFQGDINCCEMQVDTARLSLAVEQAMREARADLERQVVALSEVEELAQKLLDDPTFHSGRKLQAALDRARAVAP